VGGSEESLIDVEGEGEGCMILNTGVARPI
jgi:hypothetical protein